VAGAVAEGLDVVEQDRAHLGSGALADGSPDVADLVLQRCPEGLHSLITLELAPGKHTLQLLLGDANHIPHNPPVLSEKITVEVQ